MSITASNIIAALRTATPEEIAEFRGILTVPSTPVKAPKEKKEKVPKAPKKSVLPAGDAPTAADYRINPDDIDHSLCMARVFPGDGDKRWSTKVWAEAQCLKKVAADGICTGCTKRRTKYEGGDLTGGFTNQWGGLITEEPLDTAHMPGTAWAEAKKLVFVGAASAASDSDSTASPVDAKAAAKAAVKAAKDAEKAAAKEAAKKAKEEEKLAAKAAKEAEKAAAKAAKPAKKPAAKKAKSEPVPVEGKIVEIDGTDYMVKGDKAYAYDSLSEETGEYVGRVLADGTLDETESDSE
jgi:hypothetical protein